ncbi:unnamed protein product [Mycena citricolor]|uniref:Pre-mRNA-splicing factor CWC24 n=1 Tax=Mycena citricolor TaxID=2018698 RepID=A0AAD2JUC9_9AGAR|nr:unnamed protein product [Mycena citricolor]
MSAASEIKVPFFKKGKTRPTTARKRSQSPAPSGQPVASTSSTTVVHPTRKTGNSVLSAGSKRTTSQRADDNDIGDEDENERKRREDYQGPAVNWSSAGSKSHIAAALEIIAGDEAEEVLAKRRRLADVDGDADAGGADDGKYHGQKGYTTHLKKSSEVPKAMRVGPQRSTSTIRTVTIVDYQPDVCKDYKETGYCGFGDTCKFLHDRGTYLAGWQLDKLAETAAKDAAAGGDGDSSDSDDEDIPFACLICRKPYTDPVVTRCGHYFCSACAIKRFAKTPKCIACGAPTGGIFNRADKVLEKIRKKKGSGGDGSEDEAEEEGVDVEIGT